MKFCRVLAAFTLLICNGWVVGGQERRAFGPVEQLSWKRVEGLEISPDGERIVFVTREPDFRQNRYVKALWLAKADGEGGAVRLTDSEKDDSPKWAPDGSQVAFLSSREGAPQIWIVDGPGAQPERLTSAPGGVMSFQWSPNGRQLFYLTRNPKKGAFESQRAADSGIVINKWDFVIYKLLNSSAFLELDQTTELWMLNRASKQAEPLMTDASVNQFAVAPDGQRIAVVFQAVPGLSNQRTDVSVLTLQPRQAQVILRGSGGQDWDDTSSYSNVMWAPGGNELCVSFRAMRKRWQAKPQVGVYSFDRAQFTPIPGLERLVQYTPKFSWIQPDRLFMEDSRRASRGLYALSIATGQVTTMGEHRGSESRFSFSKDGSAMAFARESTLEPPEIVISRTPFSNSRQVTNLNGQVQGVTLPRAERAHWKSTDGVEVEGWLIKPPDFRANRKYPLIVIVHGGPGVAVPDEWEMYFEWPYPYRLFSLKGYVVLLPNYRGTGSYTAEFSTPKDLAGEPVADIVTGIRYLINQGWVDTTRVGITGHSHGGWLGPKVLVTHPEMFRAGSFAEGGTDYISAYGQMPGWLNLNIHDYYNGAPPYSSPQHYIDKSPIFHVAGLTAPVLLEFGDQSLAPQGMEFHSALWRCGVPSELIIYPRTGHNMTRPGQEAEAMERNLDWFDYWLLGKKNSGPGKEEQYQRWEKVEQEAREMRRKHPCSNR